MKAFKSLLTLHPMAWVVIVGTLLARGGFFMTIPFLGIYLHEVKHMPPSAIGLILSASFIVGTFSGFIGGPLSDRIGRYPVMAGSMVLWSLVFIGFSIANAPWLFFILNGMSGFCRSLFETAAKALLTDVTSGKERSNAFQLRYLAINLGAAAGPLIGLQMGSSSSGLTFSLTAGTYFAIALILIGSWMLAPQDHAGAAPAQASAIRFRDVMAILMKDKIFRYLLIANFFIYSGYGHLDTTVAQYMGGDRVAAYSTLFIANGLIILLFQYPVMRWTKHLSSMTNIKLGTLAFGVSLLGLGFFQSLPMLILSIALFSVGEILCFVIGDVIISDIAPANMRGTYFGAGGLAFLGQSMGAWTGGMLLDLFGYGHGAVVFTILAIVTWLALPFLQWCHLDTQKEKIPQPSTRVS